ncbi:MAG TPA: HAD family phosphatase [Bacteriovoracaceae bacterium]|nr:HAD family phosphatase [Bacteriovoracaceae bacterium]
MTRLKGFIFDMDGVVVDNHQFHFKAWMEFARKYNYHLTSEIYRDQFNGKTNADLFKMIFGKISQDKLQSFTQEKEGLYQSLYGPHLKVLKGLEEFLEFIRKSGWKIALGTSAPPANVDFVLDGLKLRKYFDVVVDGTQVEKGKPDPQVYLQCCLRIGLEPKECVVFEDSLAGLESGSRAGCQIVAVATSHKAFELIPKTELILHDFTEAKKLLKLT